MGWLETAAFSPGLINLDKAKVVNVSAVSTWWVVNVVMDDGTSHRLTGTHPTEADAQDAARALVRSFAT